MGHLHQLAVNAKPTPTHQFLRLLDKRQQLLRVYTQNIDGLEEVAGMGINEDTCDEIEQDLTSRIVELHGSILEVRCTICPDYFRFTVDVAEAYAQGVAPVCLSCIDRGRLLRAAGKREPSKGTLRPNIVLYGEAHPRGEEIEETVHRDLEKEPDVLIVMDTSLKIDGVKDLVRRFANAVSGPVILINQTKPPQGLRNLFDLVLLGDADAIVRRLQQ
ncbi:hypothetical protein GGF32_008270 [Allomyces javanicus]|nr:hypothetical protein GGF32_008270 [Allomyces javanicus]